MIPTVTITLIQKAISHEENRKLKYKTTKFTKTIINQEILLQTKSPIKIFQL